MNLKRVFSCVASAILLLITSSCGSGGPSKELIASCEKLNENILSLTREPDLYHVSDISETMSFRTDDGYFVTNIGVETRARNKQVIKEAYSFVSNYLDNATSDSGSLDNAIILSVLKEAIEGTGFELELTPSQQNSIKGDYKDPSYKLLTNEINRIIGNDDVDDEFEGPNGCMDVSKYKYAKEDSDNPYDYEKDDTSYLWSGLIGTLYQGYGIVVITNVCEATGKYLGKTCAKKDFNYKPDFSNSTSNSIKVNPWSRDWRDPSTEQFAKTVWCIENGYRDYSTSTDDCVN